MMSGRSVFCCRRQSILLTVNSYDCRTLVRTDWGMHHWATVFAAGKYIRAISRVSNLRPLKMPATHG